MFIPVIKKNPPTTSRQGLAPATSLTLVQHNILGSWDLFLSLISTLTEGPPVDVILIQDPPSSKGVLPTSSDFKSFAPPIARPSVACYVSHKFLQKFPVLPFFPPENDTFMDFDVFTPHGCFDLTFSHFTIGNAYARPLPPAPRKVSPESSLLDLEYPYLVTGDLNIHTMGPTPPASGKCRSVVQGGPERSWSTKGGLWSPWSTWSTLIYSDPHFLKFYGKCEPGWIRVDQEDQGDHNPPWWTRTGFYILLMQAPVLEGRNRGLPLF